MLRIFATWFRRRWGGPAAAPPVTATPALGRTSFTAAASRTSFTADPSRTSITVTS